MARAGRITEYSWEQDGETYRLFSKPGAAGAYIGGLNEVGEAAIEPVTRSVDGFTRRAYPGGPGISVRGHSRTTLPGGAASLRTLPGNNAYLEERIGIGSDAKTKVTTITFTGPFTALYEYVKDNKQKDFVLRSPDGTPYAIKD